MSKSIKESYSPTIYGTGLVSLDIVVSADPDKPCYQWAGGTCGNVLTILAYLGWNSFPIARLNRDTASTRVKSDMMSWGVELDFSELAPTTNTPVITQEISKDKNGQATHKFHWKNCPKCGAWLPNYQPVTLSAIKNIKHKISAANVFFFDRVSAGALDLAMYFKSLGAVIVFEPSAKASLSHLEQALTISDIVKYSNRRVLAPIRDIKSHTSAFLEIQTLGSRGLRYRSHLKLHIGSKWKTLPALKAGVVRDTCGCGDWTTAGLISKIFEKSPIEFANLSESDVVEALKYGQALAAWNCNFEGARGGMYSASKIVFNRDIRQILTNGEQKKKNYMRKLPDDIALETGSCPSCPH
jgi:fructokinase